MSRVRRNAEGFLETEQWKCRSYAAAKRRLSLLYWYVQGGYDTGVVRSEDTDVSVLHLTFSSSIDASLLQKCGTQTRIRLIDISKLVATIGEDVCQALVCLHSFT